MKIRIIAGIVLLSIMSIGLVYFGFRHEESAVFPEMYHYYQVNFYEEIGIENSVTAILLTYRMYDTIFEAVLLLASVIALMHFLSRSGHDQTGRGRESGD